MDLGATLCRRSNPRCNDCPVQQECAGYAQGVQNALPTARPKKQIPTRQVTMLLLQNSHNSVLLQQRPPVGIWGGLWCLPELVGEHSNDALLIWCKEVLGYTATIKNRIAPLRHSFSHFHLNITPVVAQLCGAGTTLHDDGNHTWYNPSNPDARGLAAPVKRLLESLISESSVQPHHSVNP